MRMWCMCKYALMLSSTVSLLFLLFSLPAVSRLYDSGTLACSFCLSPLHSRYDPNSSTCRLAFLPALDAPIPSPLTISRSRLNSCAEYTLPA